MTSPPVSNSGETHILRITVVYVRTCGGTMRSLKTNHLFWKRSGAIPNLVEANRSRCCHFRYFLIISDLAFFMLLVTLSSELLGKNF